MDQTIQLCKEHGIGIGAHPGYHDLMGFGRRKVEMSYDEVEALVTYQVGALVFHSRLLHGSGPNTTDHYRRSMICRYCDVSNLTDRQKEVFDQYGVVLEDAEAPAIFRPVT